ncbi:glycine dehydrogenase (aminomethyl-transferring) [bacterium]|nr:MAG: glycine dehydrogenase (aminomethyl-transferring) [bacterium]
MDKAVTASAVDPLRMTDQFVDRHLGPDQAQRQAMLDTLGLKSLQELVDTTIPASIRLARALDLGDALSESEALEELRRIADQNELCRSFIGMGYHGTLTPAVIQRNILENPGWYTQYTPYQPEISQGRLEALLNFQTMVTDLTCLPLTNSSLLDEGTAAAEAMAMAFAMGKRKRNRFMVSADCHPQTIAVVQGRAEPTGIEVEVCNVATADFANGEYFGLLLQYPTSDGRILDNRALAAAAHEQGIEVICAADPLALTLLEAPGSWGADIVVGSTQRFGIPMGMGGPHAAYMAARDGYKRLIPGRIIGVSRDKAGKTALRLSMQTREQHIRRDKATSNICTAQVLLAIMAGMYAAWHGPDGLRAIAQRVHRMAEALRRGIGQLGHDVEDGPVFDTIRLRPVGLSTDEVQARCAEARINLRAFDDGSFGVSLDEATTISELQTLLSIFLVDQTATANLDDLHTDADADFAPGLARTTDFLTHEVFHRFHSEHEMLRYLHRLQSRDLSLVNSMIPLGSCTMKLNASTEMMPLSWAEFAQVHPFAPASQREGYKELFDRLEAALAEITGFAAVSLQPNAGAQGEYAGLMVIRARHRDRGEGARKACLIPVSAHGTNPASAVMAGMKVVAIKCDESGNIDVENLREEAAAHADDLAALMITYPSTHGVFEETIREVCQIVHDHGGLVYMDGANMNAQVGLTRPGDMGADVCHLNLHKTFCIPHGGGGPGMGPIAATEELAPYLPGHPVVQDCGGAQAILPVSAAPWGSASILPISWLYLRMMGEEGLRQATSVAILNANYMAHRLSEHYDILYTGRGGRVAHEFILDVRGFQKSAGVSVDDFAKRLMDFGFHAPTMSWPVAGTLMVEPTESESRAELDRFCDAMIMMREEIAAIEDGSADREDNLLRNAPHTLEEVSASEWTHSYTREEAAFAAPWLREHKFFATVGRVDNAFGDRNLVCTCPTVEELAASTGA